MADGEVRCRWQYSRGKPRSSRTGAAFYHVDPRPRTILCGTAPSAGRGQWQGMHRPRQTALPTEGTAQRYTEHWVKVDNSFHRKVAINTNKKKQKTHT